jgi:ankyrin repeat protein
MIGCEDKAGTSATAKTAGSTTEISKSTDAPPAARGEAPVQPGATLTASDPGKNAAPEHSLTAMPPRDGAPPASVGEGKSHPADINSERGRVNDAVSLREQLSNRRPDHTAVVQQPEGPVDPASYIVKPEPAELDLGKVSVGEAGVGKVKLTNTGDKPMNLLECKAACGCTTSNCPKGEIAPGQSVEVEIRVTAGQVPGQTMTKNMTFVVDGQPALVFPIHLESFAYVAMEPAQLNPEKHTDGKIVLKSVDNEAFVVERMTPPIIESFADQKPAPEQTIYIDWAKWEELDHQLRIVIETTHPKARSIYCNFDPQYIQANIHKWRQTMPPVDPPQQQIVDATGKVLPRASHTLLDGARLGQVDKVQEALKSGATLTDTDQTGATALMIASEAGQPAVVEALIAAGADVNAVDKSGRSALSRAALKGQYDTLTMLIAAKADVNLVDGTGGTPLCWAAGFAKENSVRELLKAGASPEQEISNGMTPLMWAAGFGDSNNIKALLEAGAKIDAKDKISSATPLLWAARNGQAANVELLLQSGAKADEVDSQAGRTPLSWAATSIQEPEKKIALLLAAGADVNAKDSRGKTAIDHARSRSDVSASAVVAVLARAMGLPEEPAKQDAPPAEEKPVELKP